MASFARPSTNNWRPQTLSNRVYPCGSLFLLSTSRFVSREWALHAWGLNKNQNRHAEIPKSLGNAAKAAEDGRLEQLLRSLQAVNPVLGSPIRAASILRRPFAGDLFLALGLQRDFEGTKRVAPST